MYFHWNLDLEIGTLDVQKWTKYRVGQEEENSAITIIGSWILDKSEKS